MWFFRDRIFQRRARSRQEHHAVESVREIGRSHFHMTGMLEQVVQHVIKLTPARRCGIYLPESGTGRMQLRVASHPDLASRHEWMQTVYERGETSVNFPAEHGGALTILGIPLRNGSVFGVLHVESHSGQTLTRADVKLVELMADQTALAMEKVQAHRDIQRVAEKLGLVIQVGNAMSGSMDVDDVLKLIVKTAAEEMEAWACSLRLVDLDQSVLVSRASYGSGESALYLEPISVGHSVAGRVFLSKQPAIIPDLSQDNRFEYAELAEEGRLHSLVCVPLLHHDQAIGTLTVYHNEERFFTSQDVKVLTALAAQAAVSITNVQLVERLRRTNFNTMKMISTALAARDSYTGSHSDEASAYARVLAEELGLSARECELVEYGSILHDIGKIGVSDSILNKPGRLTPEEYDVMKQHPRIGAKILEPIEDFKELAKIVEHHHEHYDGSGYPDGLRDHEIPFVARILHVVDAFHAMTSDRPYRKSLPREVAVQELTRGAGKQFDPRVVEALVQSLRAHRL